MNLDEIVVHVVLLRNYKGFKKYYVSWDPAGGRQINTRYEVGRRLIALYRMAHGQERASLDVPISLEDLRKLYRTKTDKIIIERWLRRNV